MLFVQNLLDLFFLLLSWLGINHRLRFGVLDHGVLLTSSGTFVGARLGWLFGVDYLRTELEQLLDFLGLFGAEFDRFFLGEEVHLKLDVFVFGDRDVKSFPLRQVACQGIG